MAYDLKHLLLNYSVLGYFQSVLKLYLKGGSGGPPLEIFYRIGYKIKQF